MFKTLCLILFFRFIINLTDCASPADEANVLNFALKNVNPPQFGNKEKLSLWRTVNQYVIYGSSGRWYRVSIETNETTQSQQYQQDLNNYYANRTNQNGTGGFGYSAPVTKPIDGRAISILTGLGVESEKEQT